jgi:hypothetical protein
MDTVGEPSVSPRGPPSTTCYPTVPSREGVPWVAVPHLPRSYAPLRPPLPLSGRCACRSLPDTVPASPRSWCPHWARGLGEAPRSPNPGVVPGDRWFSHVPELPLCRHAPLSDPGGVLRTGHTAPRTAAFRRMQTVGFDRDTTAALLWSTTLHISGLPHAACLLAPSSFVRPLLGWHVEFAPDLLARRSSGGT